MIDRTIKLSGPQGNAFYLLGMAKHLGKELELSDEEIVEIQEEMREGDYENLLEVFKEHFGDEVTFV